MPDGDLALLDDRFPPKIGIREGLDRSRSSYLIISLRRNKVGALSLLFIVGIILTAVFANSLAPYDPSQNVLTDRLQPPSFSLEEGTHFLGTDQLGRDILSRIVFGTRVSLTVGAASVALQVLIGGLAGLMAGYIGRALETLIMRVTDVQLAIPYLALALAVIAVLGPGLINVIIVLGIIGWATYSRIVRAEVLRAKNRTYVEAARSIGCSSPRILFLHILPNIAPTTITIATLEMARMIGAEAALSYLGLGVQPPTPSWGSMVADGRDVLWIAYWVSLFPGVAILLTVVSFNLVGDWLRDYLDPTLR